MLVQFLSTKQYKQQQQLVKDPFLGHAILLSIPVNQTIIKNNKVKDSTNSVGASLVVWFFLSTPVLKQTGLFYLFLPTKRYEATTQELMLLCENLLCTTCSLLHFVILQRVNSSSIGVSLLVEANSWGIYVVFMYMLGYILFLSTTERYKTAAATTTTITTIALLELL